MNLLMIGLGDAGLERPDSEPVRRHLEYARRIRGHIDLIVESRRGGQTDFGALTVRRTGTNRAGFPAAAYRLGREAAKTNCPDLITTQDPFGTALAGLWLRGAVRRPLLIQNHSCFLFNRYWINERPACFRMYHLLAQFLLPRADAWRVVNSAERKIYVEKLGLPAERVRVLPVPCDLEIFSHPPADAARNARRRWRIPAETPVALWAGRPVRFKRLPILFRALAEIRQKFPEAILVIAGRKELAQEDLDRAARENRVQETIVWTGELRPAELAGVYGITDLILHSSIYEGFGRVLVEAGAAGLPAVATATAGAVDIVQEGETGFLVPIEDAAALADRACRLFSHPERRRRMGKAARRIIPERFAPEKMFDGIVAQWREAAAAGIRE
jgi:glycosyltransferase involved in cell wall biosynthesis